MLKALHIRNYVLIDSLDIEFPAGLVIITGQTGAGKSILLGALSLLMGGRADISAIGKSDDVCVVEAEFEVQDEDGVIGHILEDNGIDFSPDVTGCGEMLIRRVLNRNGRTRSFVNDCPASVKVLSELSAKLVDIHSQHETMLLKDKAFQMSILDRYAGNGGLLAECRDRWNHLSSLQHEYRDVSDRLVKMQAERDYNQAQFSALDAAALKDGEIAELEAEEKQLANAEEIKSSLRQIEDWLQPSGEEDGRHPIDALLKESVRLLDRLSAFVPSLGDLSERMDASRLEMADILAEIFHVEENTEVSESRLLEVEDRLSLLYGLLKKYSCQDVAGLIKVRDSFSASLSDTSDLEARQRALQQGIAGYERSVKEAASALHEARQRALDEFSADITESLRSLELPRAVFNVVLTPSDLGPDGVDSVLFRFSSSGLDPVDVAKCASGGEMSRIMLCLKYMMARYANMPSMIFDEIDTGVSGSAADRMGSMICSMGGLMQVFAITHLPQVAAKGNAHYLVSKSFVGDREVSSIRRIAGRERVLEVARLLSGAEVTPAAIANAESLLN